MQPHRSSLCARRQSQHQYARKRDEGLMLAEQVGWLIHRLQVVEGWEHRKPFQGFGKSYADFWCMEEKGSCDVIC